MDSITLENYRCFGERQTARLAPLTLLVGENSTGKTSFLAIIRALWDIAVAEMVPNFNEKPYNLGSFNEIAFNQGKGTTSTPTFFAGFEDGNSGFGFTFEEQDSAPFPEHCHITVNNSWMTFSASNPTTRVGIGEQDWTHRSPVWSIPTGPPLRRAIFALFDIEDRRTRISKKTHGHREELLYLKEALFRPYRARAFASAPVRSSPQRTYNTISTIYDAEGEYAPSYMAGLYRRNTPAWNQLKGYIEEFGANSGLFNEIDIKSYEDPGPFEIRIKNFHAESDEQWRNLIDVGYGVSQVLPILVDLLHDEPSQISLLQQPEVHLHPSAQAALGSLFCSVAGKQITKWDRRQIIIETHSDYIVDRVRMDIRDEKTSLNPEDVSILFFERVGSNVKIHSLEIDGEGNIHNAPTGYRQFFIAETDRSIGF